VGNDSAEWTAAIGTLPRTVCGQYGNKLNKVAVEKGYICQTEPLIYSACLDDCRRMDYGRQSQVIFKGKNKVIFIMIMLLATYFAKDTEVAGVIKEDKTVTMMIQEVHE
jgi:hypothetical protein